MAGKNLVIVRAGDNSLHPRWLAGKEERNWDIVVSYYGDDPVLYKSADVIRIDGKGPKWAGLYEVFYANPQFIINYDYIWLPDDDLDATKNDINRLFDICAALNLEAAQPALTWNSHHAHVTTLKNCLTKIRYGNFVEIMAPCLAAGMLAKTFHLFKDNISGFGLDYVWHKYANNPENGIAIIDDVTVWHTRPLGGPNHKFLQDMGKTARDEHEQLAAKMKMDDEPEIYTSKAVFINRRTIQAPPRRFPLILTIGFLPAVFFVPYKYPFLRRLAGMLWKGIWNIPDRAAQHTILHSKLNKYLHGKAD